MTKERAQHERLESGRSAPDQHEQGRMEDARPARDRTNLAADSEAHAGPAENLSATQLVSLPQTGPVQAPSRQPDVLSGGALVQQIKKELKRRGCYTGRIDDDWTSSETKRPLRDL
jgi:hypothetical protein